MIYDLKCPVEILACTVAEFVPDQLKASDRKQFLIFGEKDYGIAAPLLAQEWTGLRFQSTPLISQDPEKGFKLVVAHIGPDERILPTLDGYYTPVITVEQIYRQFNGPYGLVAAIHTGKDRLIWWSKQVQATLPTVYILGEDGHSEDVIERAFDMGYAAYLVEDCLVLVDKE